MRPPPNPLIEPFRIAGDPGINDGAFLVRCNGEDLRVIASDGGGWDHVSVSLERRCPTWREMCYVKDLFFKASETVVQFHPPKAQYINCHPHVLHMWRKHDGEYELPPREYV